MKKTVVVVFCLILTLLLVSCGGEKTPERSYSKIIKEYTAQLSRKQDGKEIGENSKDEIKNAILSAVNACADPALMGYATKDLDGDGTPELFLISDTYDMYALFTLHKGKPALLKVFDDGNGAIDYEGNIYSWLYTETGAYSNRYRIRDGELEGVELTRIIHENGESEYSCSFFGEERSITSSEWQTLINNFSKGGNRTDPQRQTRPSGLRFISAIEKDADPSAPLADANSYEGIIEIYRTAVSCFDSYSDDDYYAGKYDSMLTFIDNKSYEIYNRIFYSAYMCRAQSVYDNIDYYPNGKNAYGYMIKNIGGGEEEELILLNDEYNIIAIFSLVNGETALIYNYYGGELEININGDFFLSITTPVRTEWMVYELDEQNRFKLYDHVGIYLPTPDNAQYYSRSDGKYTVGTKNDYAQSISNFIRGEHPAPYPVRYCLGDGFIPIFGVTKPDKTYENKIIKRYGIIGDNMLKLSNVSENSLDFSFTYVKSFLANPTDTAFTSYEAETKATATADGNGYVFDNGTVSGRVTFGVNSVWIDIKESRDANIECYPLHFEVAN